MPLGQADLAVLERSADPRALLKAGRGDREGIQGQARAEHRLTVAQAAVDLYDTHPAVAFADLAAEIATALRHLRHRR